MFCNHEETCINNKYAIKIFIILILLIKPIKLFMFGYFD
jgi:hypothetical protein